MPTCTVCGKKFKTWEKINGVPKNMGNRRRCLNCHPWGAPRYPPRSDDEKVQASRLKSKRYYEKRKRELGVNPVTERNRRRKMSIVNFLGGSCIICKYKKTPKNITFHHCFDKDIHLDSRSLSLSMENICNELSKCIMVCHNCHGEIHAGLIDNVEKLHEEFQLKVAMLKGKCWKDIAGLCPEPERR
jgi:hypothetical protein